MNRRAWAAIGAAFTLILIAGCAGNIRASSPRDGENTASDSYAGRISLVIEPAAGGASDLSQSFSGSFELRGNAQNGQLDLLTPLGQIAVQLRWSPGMAVLIRGNERQTFASAQSLLEQATGASLSLEHLFAWLRGETVSSTQSGDWQVDLSAQPQGRISARRSLPTPALLRIILEQP